MGQMQLPMSAMTHVTYSSSLHCILTTYILYLNPISLYNPKLSKFLHLTNNFKARKRNFLINLLLGMQV